MRLHGKVHPRVRLLVKHCGATRAPQSCLLLRTDPLLASVLT
jgi:hypothetical protein